MNDLSRKHKLVRIKIGYKPEWALRYEKLCEIMWNYVIAITQYHYSILKWAKHDTQTSDPNVLHVFTGKNLMWKAIKIGCIKSIQWVALIIIARHCEVANCIPIRRVRTTLHVAPAILTALVTTHACMRNHCHPHHLPSPRLLSAIHTTPSPTQTPPYPFAGLLFLFLLPPFAVL